MKVDIDEGFIPKYLIMCLKYPFREDFDEKEKPTTNNNVIFTFKEPQSHFKILFFFMFHSLYLTSKKEFVFISISFHLQYIY
jgi:hypothetical protein